LRYAWQALAVGCFRCYIQLMKAPKKRGRPPTTGQTTALIRVPIETITRIDAWAAKQPNKPGRPEAVRALVEKALNE
jgi:hypothetical protein